MSHRLKGRVRSLEKSTLRGAPRPLGWLSFKVQVVDSTTPQEPEPPNRRAPIGMVLFRAMKALVSHWEPPKRAERTERSAENWPDDAPEQSAHDFGKSAFEELYARAKLKIPADERRAIEAELNRRNAVYRGRAPMAPTDAAWYVQPVPRAPWDEASVVGDDPRFRR